MSSTTWAVGFVTAHILSAVNISSQLNSGFLLPNVLVFKFTIGSNIAGDIKCNSSSILAKVFIAFKVAAAVEFIKSDPLPVIILPSVNSIATTGHASFLSAVSFNLLL